MADDDVINDTAPATRDLLRRRYAVMSLADKADRLRAVTLAANQMALVGLRARHPHASDASLLLELARLRLGDDVVRRVYGAR